MDLCSAGINVLRFGWWQIQGFIFVLTGVLFHISGLGVCRLVHRLFSRQRLTASYSAFSLPKRL